MPRLTNDQIDFARSMTIKQRGVLNALSMFDWFMSASERADNELYDLIRNGLARCYPHSKSDGLLSWGLTDVGRTIVLRIKKGAL
jgi:hypothetical protein